MDSTLTMAQLEALAQRKRGLNKTLARIFEWHQHYFELLNQTRNMRCAPDELPSSKSLPVLAFYIDHGIMMLNAEALRNLLSIDECATSSETKSVYKMSVDVASRLLDLAFANDGLGQLLIGFQNNQFIMICHAATEILQVRLLFSFLASSFSFMRMLIYVSNAQAMQRGSVAETSISQAAAKVKAIPGFLEKAARELPASSRIHIYLKLAQFFAAKVDSLLDTRGNIANSNAGGLNSTLADWWRILDAGPLDPVMSINGSEKLDFDLYQLDGMGFLND